MPGAFDWIHSGLLRQPDANEEVKRFLDAKAAENTAAVTGGAGSAAPPAAQPATPPMGVAQPGPGEPQAYQTPKSWGSILMDLSRQQQQEQQFNRSLGGVFATLSQPVNRERVSHTFDTTPMDPLQFGKTAMELGSQQQGQDRANQILQMVNDPVQGPALAQKMGLDWEMLKVGIKSDPGMLGRVATVMATPTTGQRELAAAQAEIEKQVRLENPTWDDAKVKAEVNRRAPPEMLLSGVGSVEDQSYRTYAAGERAAGRTPMDPIAWKEHTKNVTESKDSAVLEYPTIDQKLSINEDMVNELLANPKAALQALQTIRATTGKAANWPLIGAPEDVKKAAITINKLIAQLTGEGLSNVKNVRNKTEFVTLGQAATGALDPAQTEEGLKDALNDLKRKFATTRSIARQQAGMPEEEAPTPKKDESPKRRKYNEKGELVD